jgi:UDP-3-O-[3-hydroxymyristoyl] N-acetylglucosamine deacetylase
LNNHLLRTLMADKSAWELVTFDDNEHSPISFVQPVAVT